MEIEVTWTRILYAILFVALPIVWTWVSSEVWKWFVHRDARVFERQAKDSDTVAHNLTVAQSEMANTNKQLIAYLVQDHQKDITALIAEMSEVKTKLSALQGAIIRLEATSSIRTQDWSRMVEMWDDVEMVLDEIHQRLREVLEESHNQTD